LTSKKGKNISKKVIYGNMRTCLMEVGMPGAC
jgi:hypothetical protein